MQPLESQVKACTTQPLQVLEQRFGEKRDDIEAWFRDAWQGLAPPIYGSVDLRNAGFKLAPIDMNLFPAGFNNLSKEHFEKSARAIQNALQDAGCHAVKHVLILPEGHTRNIPYWENMATLQGLLERAGLLVSIGSLDADLQTAQSIPLSQTTLTVYPLKRQDGRLMTDAGVPDMVLLNNDLSAGIPDILQNITTPILPPAALGWSARLKSQHFLHYEEVATSFAKAFAIDSWWINPLFEHCGPVDFIQREGMDCVIAHAENLLSCIRAKYAEYEITHEPFIIVKADAGTYGMAVMTVRNVDDLRSLNRKERTRMSMTKGNQAVNRVIIQEGVYTFEAVGEPPMVSEPVVYLWGKQVVGGFYRMHSHRGVDENLNAPGMHFLPMAFSSTCSAPPDRLMTACEMRYYAYGVVARLSMLAASHEMRTVL